MWSAKQGIKSIRNPLKLQIKYSIEPQLMTKKLNDWHNRERCRRWSRRPRTTRNREVPRAKRRCQRRCQHATNPGGKCWFEIATIVPITPATTRSKSKPIPSSGSLHHLPNPSSTSTLSSRTFSHS